MSQVFNDELLEAFIRNFYGYGNFEGDYWFVGLEQGGGNSFEEVEKRLDGWHKNGRRALEDAAKYHQAIGLGDFFHPKKPRLQSTWARLIRTIYGFKGHDSTDISAKKVKTYQRDKFLRLNSSSCSIELLPLPSPSMNDWLYANHSALPHLKTRSIYRDKFARDRADTMQEKIAAYKPRFVMFYGLHPEYITWWKYIADVPFETIDITPKFTADFARDANTTYVISRHPVAFGVTNTYWHTLGQIIARYGE